LELIAEVEFFVSRQDELDWANADPMVIGRNVSGYHIGGGSKQTYIHHMRDATDWLARRAGLVPRQLATEFSR
jgi:hypothetical protein